MTMTAAERLSVLRVRGRLGELVTPAVAAEAARDVATALFRLPGAAEWLSAHRPFIPGPLTAETWVFDLALEHVLLVEHRWRGHVPPGGKVHYGESPRIAAGRELREETGLTAELLPRPAMAFVRRFRADSPRTTLGLSYVAVVDKALPLVAEPGQAARWQPLQRAWPSVVPEDSARIRQVAQRLRRAGARPQDYATPQGRLRFVGRFR